MYKIDKIYSLNLRYMCPNCKKEIDLEKIKDTRYCYYQHPHFCPHCGFDLQKYDEEQNAERERYIDENPYCQLKYDVIGADLDCGVNEHPQIQMELLGYKILDAVPEPIADCWLFTVDKFIEPLPKYLKKIRYEIGEV